MKVHITKLEASAAHGHAWLYVQSCKTPQIKAKVRCVTCNHRPRYLQLSLRVTTLPPYQNTWQRVYRGSKTSTSVCSTFTEVPLLASEFMRCQVNEPTC